MKIRHNPAKYERRKAIRAEASRRLHAAKHKSTPFEYSLALEHYLWARDKIRRYYDRWGFR